MAELKTKENNADVYEFIDNYANTERKRKDSIELVKIFENTAGYSAKMWGDSIIGFGKYHSIGISFIINHVITLLFPYYARAAYPVEIKKGDKVFAYKWFLLYLFIVSIINPFVNGNYFYFKYKPIFPEMANYIYIPLVIVFVYLLFSLGEIIFKKIAKE